MCGSQGAVPVARCLQRSPVVLWCSSYWMSEKVCVMRRRGRPREAECCSALGPARTAHGLCQVPALAHTQTYTCTYTHRCAHTDAHVQTCTHTLLHTTLACAPTPACGACHASTLLRSIDPCTQHARSARTHTSLLPLKRPCHDAAHHVSCTPALLPPSSGERLVSCTSRPPPETWLDRRPLMLMWRDCMLRRLCRVEGWFRALRGNGKAQTPCQLKGALQLWLRRSASPCVWQQVDGAAADAGLRACQGSQT